LQEETAQNTFTLGESHTYWVVAWEFSVPQMRTLCRFILLHTWNVVSSLKTSFSANPSSRSRCWKSKQKGRRRLWSWVFSARYPFTRRRLRRMHQTLDWDICNSRLARFVDFWGLLTSVSRTRSSVSADGPGRPVRFAAHRQPLCWNFMYHSRIVLSLGGSVWYMIRNLRCTVTIDSVLANSKTQNAFLFTMYPIFRHDYPLAVEPASTPRPLVQKKLGEILYLLICSFLSCLSWLLRSPVRKSWGDLWIILYVFRFLRFLQTNSENVPQITSMPLPFIDFLLY